MLQELWNEAIYPGIEIFNNLAASRAVPAEPLPWVAARLNLGSAFFPGKASVDCETRRHTDACVCMCDLLGTQHF